MTPSRSATIAWKTSIISMMMIRMRILFWNKGTRMRIIIIPCPTMKR
jgi:hypothetical protein